MDSCEKLKNSALGLAHFELDYNQSKKYITLVGKHADA